MQKCKKCPKCERTLSVVQNFHMVKHRGRLRPNSYCKKCAVAWTNAWRKTKPSKYFRVRKQQYAIKNSDKVKRWSMRSRWKRIGLDPNVVEAFIAIHNGVCDICGEPPNGMTLAVDHCHDTMILRGLLCSNCNVGLGMFEDNPELLRRAIKYLKTR